MQADPRTRDAGGVAALTIKTPNVVFSTTLCPDLGK